MNLRFILGSIPGLAPMFCGFILTFPHWQALFVTLSTLEIILIMLTLCLAAENFL